MRAEQNHLNFQDTVNFGSFYSPDKLVDLVYDLIARNVPEVDDYLLMDTSCGYGSFLRGRKSIGADIDLTALQKARQNSKGLFYHHNSLKDVSRQQYNLGRDDKIIIVGNPPYNDTTSIIRNGLKRELREIDSDLKARDLGLSFLLSYDRLRADFVCVLHPLSYLIKRANFAALGAFKSHYRLKDALVISSAEFSATSKITQFPIAAALYERDLQGMSYDFICRHPFKTLEGQTFAINDFDNLTNYITKYPNQNSVSLEKAAAFFWTMRDINALKRSRTFIENETGNSIRVPLNQLTYYCYADVFKDFIKHLPYYFGNCEIMINHDEFQKISRAFMIKSLTRHPFLSHLLPPGASGINYDFALEKYFKNLLREHYVD